MDASPCSRRPARSRPVISTRTWISRAASRRTPSPTFACWATTTGDYRIRISGRLSGCCSTRRTHRFRCPTRAFTRSAHAIARSRRNIRIESRFCTKDENVGRRFRASFCALFPPARLALPALIKVEVAGGLGDRLFLGLLQRFFESLRQRIAARALGGHRLVERGVAPLFLLGQNLLGV